MKPPDSTRAVAIGIGVVVLQALMVIAFAWPAVRTDPRDVPLVVAGPEAAAVAVSDRLTRERPGAFDIERVADEPAAREALTDRDAYGAIVVGPSGPRVLVASAASPVLAQQLGQLAQQLSGAPVAAAHDVVPADSDDPRGAGFAAMVLPLVMSGLAAAGLLTLLVSSVAWRAVGVLVFAVLGGFAGVALAQGWLSLLPGSYLAVSAAVALGIFAVTATVAGLSVVIGRAGLGLGALTMLLLGNPLSAAASAPELLPEPWGAIGQALPPGATVSLLRSVAFFDGAAAGGPLTVLLVWSAAAIALFAAGALKGGRARTPAPTTPDLDLVPSH
ncbi:hypothetical protein [Actinomadura alba]|uniref:ABC transporter permease n=1 Tax=Actinomadura alba TaxID=406431 RepID=A0ABR7LGS1_9ACTN|nr:hypothetical protein [Actinomadura alba]MBC6464027.1 hypothetical protein [Actinomadura alba]